MARESLETPVKSRTYFFKCCALNLVLFISNAHRLPWRVTNYSAIMPLTLCISALSSQLQGAKIVRHIWVIWRLCFYCTVTVPFGVL